MEAMSAIEIPYLPISGFKESIICEKFAEAENSGVNADKNLMYPEEKDLHAAVVLLLHGMGMEKYVDLFQKENVSLETFILLSDSDLQELGVTSPKDREIIIKNLELYQIKKREFVIQEDHIDDLQMAKNVFSQLLLIQNYCTYIELQMRKHKLTDYKIGWRECASIYLKAFMESAIIQTKRLSSLLFVEGHYDHLIGKILLKYDLALPKHLKDKLKSNRKSYSSSILKAMVAVGFCSLILLTGKCMIGRKRIF